MAVINVRLTDEEVSQLNDYQKLLEEQFGVGVRVTQRTVIVKALEALGNTLNRAEKPQTQPETAHSGEKEEHGRR